MGRIGKVLSFIRTVINGGQASQTRLTYGEGYNVTSEHWAPPGDDGNPMPGDYVFTVPNGREGGVSTLGYIDTKNAGVAASGERRIYGRDASGAPVCEVWCKKTGDVLSSNDNGSTTLAADGSITGINQAGGSFSLQAGGNFVVNGVTIDLAGNITTSAAVNSATVVATATVTAPTVNAATTLTAAGKNVGLHQHLAGTPPGNTGNNI